MTTPLPGSDYTQRMRLARLPRSLILVTVAILPGCGQKGPLYLPDLGGEVITRPTQTPGATTPAPNPPPASSPAPKSSQDEPKPPR